MIASSAPGPTLDEAQQLVSAMLGKLVPFDGLSRVGDLILESRQLSSQIDGESNRESVLGHIGFYLCHYAQPSRCELVALPDVISEKFFDTWNGYPIDQVLLAIPGARRGVRSCWMTRRGRNRVITIPYSHFHTELVNSYPNLNPSFLLDKDSLV